MRYVGGRGEGAAVVVVVVKEEEEEMEVCRSQVQVNKYLEELETFY